MKTAMLADLIMQMLKGSDAQHTCSRSAMLAESGLDPAPLDAALESLYATSEINRVYIFKGGQWEHYYWLTGAVARAVPWSELRAGIPAPLRGEPQMPPAPAENISQETVMESQQPKSKARQILEMLVEQGSINGREICKALQISSINPYIKGQIARRQVLITNRLGKHQGKNYSLAPGVTAEMLFADQRLKAIAGAEPQVVVTPATTGHLTTAAPSNIKEFKRPPAAMPPDEDRNEEQEADRNFSYQQVSIDPDGQLVIRQPGLVRMVFPAPDTLRIQKLFLAIDLESLCA